MMKSQARVCGHPPISGFSQCLAICQNSLRISRRQTYLSIYYIIKKSYNEDTEGKADKKGTWVRGKRIPNTETSVPVKLGVPWIPSSRNFYRDFSTKT